MRKPIKYVEKAVVVAAKGTWAVFERLNRIKPNPSPTPKWSEKPLQVVREVEASAGLAADDRFAVPQVRAGNPAADSRRAPAA